MQAFFLVFVFNINMIKLHFTVEIYILNVSHAQYLVVVAIVIQVDIHLLIQNRVFHFHVEGGRDDKITFCSCISAS